MFESIDGPGLPLSIGNQNGNQHMAPFIFYFKWESPYDQNYFNDVELRYTEHRTRTLKSIVAQTFVYNIVQTY